MPNTSQDITLRQSLNHSYIVNIQLISYYKIKPTIKNSNNWKYTFAGHILSTEVSKCTNGSNSVHCVVLCNTSTLLSSDGQNVKR